MREVMQLVRRDRLVQLLRDATANPLTLVQAPFGYGKTVAVRQFAAEAGARVVWVDLSGRRTELPRPDLLASTSEATLVVFDGLDAAGDGVSRQLARLVTGLPPHVRVLLVCRREPRLPLARWRAEGLVADVGADDLRFRSAETIAAFDDGTLDEDDIAALRRMTERAEGWAAGLRLLAPSRGESFDAAAGSRLVDAVLAGQPPELREFLVATSILFTFTADLCRAVTGRADAGRLIEQARAANLLLLPVDDNDLWFRYQRLFAELLRARLAARGADEVRALHRRAATWLLERQEPDAAGHLVAAGEGDDALIRLVGEVDFLSRGSRSPGVDWSRVFPERWVEESPLRMIYVASVLTRTGWQAQAGAWLDAAERAVSDDPAERALLAAARAVWHALDGDGDDALRQGRAALDLMEDPGATPVGRRLLVMLALLHLVREQPDEAATLCDPLDHPQAPDIVRVLVVPAVRAGVAERRGELTAAERLARSALQTVETLDLPFPLALSEARIALARVLREQGEFDEAEVLALAAAEAVESQGWSAIARYCRLELAKVRVARSGVRLGLELVDQMRAGPLPGMLVPVVDAMEARLRLSGGELDRAEELLDVLPPVTQTAVMRARIALARHDLTGAEAQLAEVGGDDVRSRLLRSLVRARIAAARGETAVRDEHLLEAARVGADEGFCAVFLELGLELLDELRALAEARGRLRPLLVRIDRYLATVAAGAPQDQPLSQRELGVLRYLPSRLTNREIASELDITTNTLKTHLRSLYRKLNVSSRAEAVREARAAGLLRR